MWKYVTSAVLALIAAASLCLANPGGGIKPGNNNAQNQWGRSFTVTDSLECGLTGTIKVEIDLAKKITITLEGKNGKDCHWKGMSYEFSLSGNGNALIPDPKTPMQHINKVIFQKDGSEYNQLDVRLDVYDARETETHHLFVKLECFF